MLLNFHKLVEVFNHRIYNQTRKTLKIWTTNQANRASATILYKSFTKTGF